MQKSFDCFIDDGKRGNFCGVLKCGVCAPHKGRALRFTHRSDWHLHGAGAACSRSHGVAPDNGHKGFDSTWPLRGRTYNAPRTLRRFISSLSLRRKNQLQWREPPGRLILLQLLLQRSCSFFRFHFNYSWVSSPARPTPADRGLCNTTGANGWKT